MEWYSNLYYGIGIFCMKINGIEIFYPLFKDVVISEKCFNSITDKEPIMTPAGSYQYAKTAAEKKAWAWIEANKPKFDLIVLLAPSITGRCIQEGFVPVKSALGGMGDIYRNIFDVKTPGFLFPYWM
jgi:hypothetical protein